MCLSAYWQWKLANCNELAIISVVYIINCTEQASLFELFVHWSLLIFSYDDFDIPDTMNVHGVYDTSATMQTFYSREEYQQSLQQQQGISGSIFGFYAGVKKAWGSSSLKGAQKYMALFSIDIDR